MSRFSRGDRPLSQALRACTISASAPAASTIAANAAQRRLRILLVDADAALHRDRDRDRGLHRGDAIADQRGLRHQAGAEAALLHAVGRAADVEIDLAIAELLADARASRERRGIASRRAEARPDARPDRNRAAAAGRRAAPRRSSPSRCRAARRRVSRRWKNRQCRSVHSIIGAIEKVRFSPLMSSFSAPAVIRHTGHRTAPRSFRACRAARGSRRPRHVDTSPLCQTAA